MSLREEYFDGSTGLTQKMTDAAEAGYDLVDTLQNAAIITGLQAAAAAGLKKFTVTVPVIYQPATLRAYKGDNLILKSFLSGVSQALSEGLIFDFECEPKLNTADTVDTKIDLNFSFA